MIDKGAQVRELVRTGRDDHQAIGAAGAVQGAEGRGGDPWVVERGVQVSGGHCLVLGDGVCRCVEVDLRRRRRLRR